MNRIPDECDIANCPPGDPSCADCNSNGIPDGCDINNPIYVEAADNSADAELACPNFTYYGSTSGATVDGSAACGDSNSTPDVWYYYESIGYGSLTISLCNSAYDTVLSVHNGWPGN